MRSVSAYPFSQEEFERAAMAWGANCGPAALAFALAKPIDAVRPAIPDFDSKRYTSPSMMKSALAYFDAQWYAQQLDGSMFDEDGVSLVRIQFTGPWTAPGMNPRWAYQHTHWIATLRWKSDAREKMVFDCNGGLMTLERWEKEIIPILTAMRKRSDGGWRPTHIWTIVKD